MVHRGCPLCVLLYYIINTQNKQVQIAKNICSVFILCNYIKKSTVCQQFYPAKTIAHNFCNYIFYYTKKQPISRLFFLFVLYVKLTFYNLLFSITLHFFSISSISRLFPSFDNYICYNSVYYTCNQA